MKSKVFKLHALKDSDESALDEFLETVNVRQIFAQIVSGEDHFWSILVFYEDDTSGKAEKSERTISAAKAFSTADKTKRPENPTSESIILTPEQENVFNELKKWRNEKASADGIPPYLIAHNFSLVQIAASGIKSKEGLVEIKGFGEKRAEKYGDEILAILDVSFGESKNSG